MKKTTSSLLTRVLARPVATDIHVVNTAWVKKPVSQSELRVLFADVFEKPAPGNPRVFRTDEAA